MQKSEIKILIVDDDVDMTRIISEVIRRGGYQVIVCTQPHDAINQFRIQGAQLIIIDCLLPQMSGVQLAQELRKAGAKETPIILTSAIYKDKSFIRDSVKTVGAAHFIAKPFDLPKLQEAINGVLEHLVDAELSPRERLLGTTLTPSEKLAQINRLEEIDGYELPWIYGLVSNPAVTGKLMLKDTNRDVHYELSMHSGKIVNLDSNNPQSFFGAILIENGYVSLDELNRVLQIQDNNKIGERLVKYHLLSPHVIDLVRKEQMGLRLSQAIRDTTYNVQFTEGGVEDSNVAVEASDLCVLLSDWMYSKIKVRWLESYHMRWRDKAVSSKATVRHLEPLLNMTLLKSNPSIKSDFEKGQSLDQVLARHQQSDVVFRIFHLLLILEGIQVQPTRRELDGASQISRLEGILAHMKKQDYFGVLGLKRNSKAADVKRTYYEMAKLFHPDKLPPNAPAKLRDLTQKIFGIITKAHETISDDAKKDQYIKSLDLGNAEKILQAEELLELGKGLLKSGQPLKALEKFDAAKKLKPPTGELIIHWAWARLASTSEKDKNHSETILNVNQTLEQLAPEERHNPPYYFVKAMLQKSIGDMQLAKKMVTQALALDPKFIEAERLNRIIDLNSGQPKNVNILTGDLKDVVGLLFKKK